MPRTLPLCSRGERLHHLSLLLTEGYNMALLDQLLSGLTGVSGSPLRGVLMNVLGHGGSQTGGAGGGLGGLLSSFRFPVKEFRREAALLHGSVIWRRGVEGIGGWARS